ncbi:histidine kinase famiy protein [Caballeronia sp. LZ062]|uniref:histidine kinase famiy protein n=1 Tax=unclassified Caballeronia TaxID=2646786 RepID=UPI002865FE15|nr:MULTISPECIES: histidine kinase famiy protein [unclassified Caballeronia]MDR5857708.1 histidine kinase famiy protein [Caballeronia sp. LZ050]MDR5869258.1 histidine kinase famiy protein [Caballeronia sp. LZ062]
MAQGSDKDEVLNKRSDDQGDGQSIGRPADGELEGSAYSPLGNPGVRHWQASQISRPGLDDRGNIFFAAVEMTRMPMVVTDPNQPDDPVVFVNRAFLDLTEYTEEQVLGRNCRFLQGPETDARTVTEIRNALREQRAVAVDVLNYKASGKAFWNALFIGPVFNEEGKLLYWFSSQMDITRRRISEQSFLQAQKMEAIGQLTAGLAHDFNNLLQIITGNLELAAASLDDRQGTREAIGRAMSAGEKAGKLTQQLLTFARKQRLEPRQLNLNTLVVEFSEMLVRTLGDKIDLHLDLKPGLPACTIDATHMEMALLNVLINARDAMPKGGRVTVATSVINDSERIEAHNLQPGTYVVICVIDHGEGMTPDVVRRATEPFFTTKGPGTGLGLAMVHGFVQQSHGRLEIDSTPGHGTTIRMIFPVVSQPEKDNPSQNGEKSLNWSTDAILGKHTVLVVDDNRDVRELAFGHLQKLGYRVLSAQSGEEALRVIERYGDVDLLFTDIIMPGGMNGLQLVERVRERKPDIAVLLATGYMDQLPAANVSAGSITTLTKPYRVSDLAEQVRASLEKKVPPQAVEDFRHEG